MSDHDYCDDGEKPKTLASLEGLHNLLQWTLAVKSESMLRKFSFTPKGGQKIHSKIQFEIDPTWVVNHADALKTSIADYSQIFWET
eukprot:151895-Rhodomonas_salina.1